MNSHRSMRAAFIRATGGVERIEYGELPVPLPGPTDVLVRLEASEANHVDCFVRSGAYATDLPFPFVIGRDLVGTVVATGSGVTRFVPGERAWCNSLGHHGRQGAWSEYVAVAEERLYALPEGVDVRACAAVLHGGGTAALGLQRAALVAGETLFVEGGGGAVGSAVIQTAHETGARVLASAAPGDEHWCRASGADVFFDYHAPDLYQQVAAAAPDGIHVWWDTSGHNRFAAVLPQLAMRGRVVLMSGLQGGSDPVLPVGALYTRDITVHGFAISNASVAELASAATTINRLLAAGTLRGRIGATHRLADAARAHTELETGKVHGRIVIVP